MKKTKLLTSIAMLALVLSLGACGEVELGDACEGDDESCLVETTDKDSDGSKESSSNNEEDSTPGSGDASSESGLGSGDWKGGNAINPQELVEKAYYQGNYSVEIQYNYYESNDTITYEEYEAAYNDDAEALEKLYALEEDVSLNTSIVIDIYYDVDYILVYEYLVKNEDYYLLLLDLVVNDNGVWEYYTEDGYYWYYYNPSYFATYGIYTWEDGFGSLFYTYEAGYLSHLVYYENYGAYDFDDWTYIYLPQYSYAGYVSEASANWFLDLGGDWLFGSYAYSYAYYYDVHYFTYFSETYQQLMSWFCYPYLSYVDESRENLYYGEEDIYMYVYDVGETDESNTVYYYHNYFQSVL